MQGLFHLYEEHVGLELRDEHVPRSGRTNLSNGSTVSEVERHKWYEHAWNAGCVWLRSRLSIVVPSSCMLNSIPLFMHALFMHASSVFVLN